jgi:hypothetical protein
MRLQEVDRSDDSRAVLHASPVGRIWTVVRQFDAVSRGARRRGAAVLPGSQGVEVLLLVVTEASHWGATPMGTTAPVAIKRDGFDLAADLVKLRREQESSPRRWWDGF